MAVTLADVAARARVSPATVSRVLNGNYPVADATRERVERAVRDLDYVVNAHARALLHATSGMIGVVLGDIADPYFAGIAKGLQAAAAELRRLVVICSSQGSHSAEFAYVEMLRRQRAEIVVLVGGAPDDPAYRRELASHTRGLKAQGARLILCGRPAPNRHTPAGIIEFDTDPAYRALVQRLVQDGHQRIAYIAGADGLSTTAERRKSFQKALYHAHVDPDSLLVASGDFTRRGGYDAIQRLLANGVRFTALVAANDLMAIGALAALRDADVQVPNDVSVSGLGDIPGALDVTPSLTTLRLPLEEAGRRSVSLAFAGHSPVKPVRLAAELVVRDSTASRLGRRDLSGRAARPSTA